MHARPETSKKEAHTPETRTGLVRDQARQTDTVDLSQFDQTGLLQLQRLAGNDSVSRLVELQRSPSPAVTAPPRGPASAEGIERDARDRLEKWRRAAGEGVQNFTDNELIKMIEKAGSFDTSAFLASLVGNTIWAATIFLPGVGQLAAATRLAFAISLSGIAIAAAGSLPRSKESSPLMHVKKGMEAQLDETQRQFLKQLPSVSARIVAERSIDNDHALELLLTSNCMPEYLEAGSGGALTEIAEAKVRSKYERDAAETLTRYLNEVEPVGKPAISYIPGERMPPEKTHWELIRVEGVGLAVASLIPPPGLPEYQTWLFRSWVSQQMKDQALSRAKKTYEQVQLVDPRKIEGLPS